jgi:hypothetical protein
MHTILLLLAALAGHTHGPAPVATPIGTGPGYRPAAATAAVRDGRPVGTLACRQGLPTVRSHLELFVHGRVVVLPAGIGIASPLRLAGGAVTPLGCRYPVSTVDPTGVIYATAGSASTLADVFRIWHQPLSRHNLLGFTSRRPLRVFVNGRRRTGDPRLIRLRRHAEIVVELGRAVPPHRSYLFPEQP